MTANNKISHLIKSQVPFFVRNDHQKFISFLETYYEYLEQNSLVLEEGKAVNRVKNLINYFDIDTTLDDFISSLYEKFLASFPTNTIADEKIILKHVKDFFRAKGTEKSYRFLMRALFDEEIEFYYPKKDILRASDGKWYIRKTIRISDIKIEGVEDSSLSALEKYVGRKITGNSSDAEAIIESVERFYEAGIEVNELTLSSINGSFQNGEEISSTFFDNDELKNITAIVFGGVLSSIVVTVPGSNYIVGQHPIVSGDGENANVVIDRVSTGNIPAVVVTYGGAGYKVNDLLLISGSGSGANAKLATVDTSEIYHPNSYNIYITTITSLANVALNSANYAVNSATMSNGSNANTTLINALSYFVYSNTGPALTVTVISSGEGYEAPPTISATANSRIQSLGILGRMEIVNPGINYKIGDTIEFINQIGGYGTGASASVTGNTYGASNGISSVEFVEVPGQYIGGSGYSQSLLPSANVISITGNGAVINVTSILGFGSTYVSSNTKIGAIQSIAIVSRGTDYTQATIDLSGLGDGTAKALATVVSGVYSYPGRYLNDDGHISSFNFLQNRDYYQNFSYVIKVKESLEKYRTAVKELLHPAGMKLFGEYVTEDVVYRSGETVDIDENTTSLKFYSGTYDANSEGTGNIIFTLNNHGFQVGNTVYIEFRDSNTGVSNFSYTVTSSPDANTFNITKSNVTTSVGTALIGKIIL